MTPTAGAYPEGANTRLTLLTPWDRRRHQAGRGPPAPSPGRAPRTLPWPRRSQAGAPSPSATLLLPPPGTDLLRVAGVDVEVAELLVVVVLVVQVLQRLPLLVLAELGGHRER